MLGIEPGPSGVPNEDVVSTAFKKLAVKWHPDRNPDNVEEATQRFAEMSAARDLLLDPPTNAFVDESVSAGGGRGTSEPQAKAAGPNLRAFEGDVTDAVTSGLLQGAEAVALFEGFGMWAVWKCDRCEAICCRIRKNKYACMCGHRLRDHDAGRGFRCAADPKCPCTRFSFQVQDTDQPHKCRCKHAPKDHDPMPPHACRKCDACQGFDSPWVCNCGHAPREHRTCFVRHKYPERAREWVAGGLRGECVAMARKFRSRTIAERVSFVQRANAAKAAGYPSWKAMQREARLHDKYGTSAQPPPGTGADASQGMDVCGECDEASTSASRPAHATPSGLHREATTRAGFRPGQETTHGLSTDELRERLAAAGVGLRPAVANDFQPVSRRS